MKLIMSIVHSDDASRLSAALTRRGYRATVISTTGGFLREGNATLLIGVRDDQVEGVLEVIKKNCRTRTQYVNPLPPVMEPGEIYMSHPVEVEVGGATVFILTVERFERF